MLDQRRAAAQPQSSREEIFAERYETLLEWALQLTHQQRDSAEDLVQDAFVQFMLARTQLEEIENVNGYLRRLLRSHLGPYRKALWIVVVFQAVQTAATLALPLETLVSKYAVPVQLSSPRSHRAGRISRWRSML